MVEFDDFDVNTEKWVYFEFFSGWISTRDRAEKIPLLMDLLHNECACLGTISQTTNYSLSKTLQFIKMLDDANILSKRRCTGTLGKKELKYSLNSWGNLIWNKFVQDGLYHKLLFLKRVNYDYSELKIYNNIKKNFEEEYPLVYNFPPPVHILSSE